MGVQDIYNLGSALLILVTHYAAFVGTPKAVLASKALNAVWKHLAGNHRKAENIYD